MRTKSKLFVCLVMCVAVMLGVGFVACSKDEPTPEVIENPLDAEVYYITGKVSQASTPLEGVTVSTSGAESKSEADGTFQLEVAKKGDYTVSLAKEGFITVSVDAEIEPDASKRSSVSIAQELTKANAPVTIKPDAEAVVSGGANSAASLNIPVGAVTKATDITVTEYRKGAKKGDVHASLSTINCQPDGLKFEKSVNIAIKNNMSSAIYLADVAHYVEKNGVWTKASNASYDTKKNMYETELTGFSNHSFGPNCVVAVKGSTNESLGEVSIDNLGKMTAKEGAVTGKQKFGWEIDGNLSDLLKAQFPSLNSTDIEGLVATLSGAISSSKGVPAGVSESTLSLGTAKVSGDTKMTVSFAAVIKSTTGTFNLVYQGKPATISIPIKTYNGISTKISYQYGSSHTDHSGGGGK